MSADPIGNVQRKRLTIFGAGYVGSAVASAAIQLGHEVTALTRNPDRVDLLQRQGVRVIQADLASGTWHDSISRSDWVLNCVSSGGGGSLGYHHSYVEGLRSITAWLTLIGKVDTLVYTSSTSVYPQKSGTVDEQSGTAEAVGNARILLEAERLVFAVGGLGLANAAVVLRLAGIYGPARHHLLDQLRTPSKTIGGKGDHLLNLVHRDDIVSAILCAFSITSPGSYLFNVTDDTPSPKAEIVAWLAEKLGVPQPEFSGEPVGGRRLDPPDRRVSNLKIKGELGWRPRYPRFSDGYRAILEA